MARTRRALPALHRDALQGREPPLLRLRQIQQHLGLLPLPQLDLPTSSEPVAPTEDTTPAEVQISPPQEATTNAIASDDPQDEPQTVDTVTATPADASSPLEGATT
ncbi:hypothetical protein CK203_034839 [Vitis vinifera]|uniref:Uncharacterized protein n=1 Tax=Vitis vinifera TaxID=29760 RepID=A0A438ICA4_VITVI|nr:hypothetical protein CK203_034839 [Vitis vinifera]